MQRAMGKVRSAGRRASVPVSETEKTPKAAQVMEGMEKREVTAEDGKPMVRFMNFTSNLSALEEHDNTEITDTTTTTSDGLAI